jgi:hypothetical protein
MSRDSSQFYHDSGNEFYERFYVVNGCMLGRKRAIMVSGSAVYLGLEGYD